MPSEYIALPSLILTTALCSGWYLLLFPDPNASKGSRDGLSYADLRFRGLGIRLTEAGYRRILFILCTALVFFSLMKTLREREAAFALAGALAAFYIHRLLLPREHVFGSVRSIFAMALDMLAASRRKKFDRGLYTCCVVLRNLAIVQKSAPLSADQILERIARCASKELQPLFWSMLSMYRTGKADQAFRTFAASVGTPAGRASAGIFAKLDSINPAELLEQTTALIDAMREARVTAGHIRAQRSGVITMALATATIMTAMLDFLVVVVYMDLMQMLVTTW